MAEQVMGWKSNSGKIYARREDTELEDDNMKIRELFEQFANIHDLDMDTVDFICQFIRENKSHIKSFINKLEGMTDGN